MTFKFGDNTSATRCMVLAQQLVEHALSVGFTPLELEVAASTMACALCFQRTGSTDDLRRVAERHNASATADLLAAGKAMVKP